MKKLDIVLEDLESLGLRHISLNDCNDTEELENLCDKIKESWLTDFRDTYNEIS